MKREEKNALARQRTLEAAMREFSARGYEGASLNTVCTENDLSKGMIYHHFKDKDEIYLLCVERCFDALCAYLTQAAEMLSGTAQQRLCGYFDARLRFFAENPLYSGIFTDAILRPPGALSAKIAKCRQTFDSLNIRILTQLLDSVPLREGLYAAAIAQDFKLYMDFFNMHLGMTFSGDSAESLLREHEERCHRQLDILLHGVLGEDCGNR